MLSKESETVFLYIFTLEKNEAPLAEPRTTFSLQSAFAFLQEAAIYRSVFVALFRPSVRPALCAALLNPEPDSFFASPRSPTLERT